MHHIQSSRSSLFHHSWNWLWSQFVNRNVLFPDSYVAFKEFQFQIGGWYKHEGHRHFDNRLLCCKNTNHVMQNGLKYMKWNPKSKVYEAIVWIWREMAHDDFYPKDVIIDWEGWCIASWLLCTFVVFKTHYTLKINGRIRFSTFIQASHSSE